MIAKFTLTLFTLFIVAPCLAADSPPFKYLDAKAYYVLPETHNNQSGYFSLCEGLDGKLYIGTARYGENAHLVEFDPRGESQRMVIDVNKLCGLTAKDYAAQAKVHTRNFVGPRTGKIYVGSKQGYRLRKDDTSEYPGGYAMAYDPRTGAAENLGMPMPKQGVIDVAADEERDLLYVVTCEDQHWMLGSATKGAPYRELGPMLTPYAMTLIAADGCGYTITKDFELARYDPETQKVTTRPIEINGDRWTRPNNSAIPTWQLAPDHKSAFLILMNDPTLLQIPLVGGQGTVAARSFGKMIDGKHPDSRCGLDVAPDGRVYAIVRVDNDTGFGNGYLHHILRFDPKTQAHEDLGVLRVSNPDYFDWNTKGPDGKKLPWTHGFHRLPDDALTPLHAHMSLVVARDNTVYVTIIYPFTLLRIDSLKPRPAASAAPSPAQAELDAALAAVERTEKLLPKITEAAQTLADRHVRGGQIGCPFYDQPLMAELYGRSGNLMFFSFRQKPERPDEQKRLDVAIVAYDKPAGKRDADALRKLKDQGMWIIGFGPASLRMSECDTWIDTCDEPGLRATMANALAGWALMAEVTSAITRLGKTPILNRSWSLPDGREWSEKYLKKGQPFHDDVSLPPIAAGELGRKFLQQIRYPLCRLNVAQLRAAAEAIAEELKARRKTVVAWQGHMPQLYVGKYGTESWATAAELHPFLDSQIESYRKKTPEGALVLSLGYHGVDPKGAALWKEKKQRVIHLAGDHTDPAWRNREALIDWIDLGMAQGDACVTIEGYPCRAFPPSGVAQLAAYAAIHAEVMARTPRKD
jgi:hypothetical protein